MTTYNTGNPVPSTDVRDLFDNAQNLDTAVNDRSSRTWADRLGVSRQTYYGMEQAFQDFLVQSGYVDIGDYGPGLVITARNQTFAKDGELYRAGPNLELPYTTTGDWVTEGSSFVSVGDAALRQALAQPSGASLIGYRRSGAGATATTQDKVNERVIHVMDFGADPTGTTDSYPAVMAAIHVADILGGGEVRLPRGKTRISQAIVIGNGSASQVSTWGHRITIVGEGIGSHNGQDFVQQDAPSEILYDGPTIATGAFVWRGPLHAVGMRGFTINANGRARGIDVIHVADGRFDSVITKNPAGIGWLYTTQAQMPPGCTYGCGNIVAIHCYSTMPATVDTIGIKMTSGAPEGVSLTGNADTANVDVIGGAYFYGGSANSCGLLLHGADNNVFYGVQFIVANKPSFAYGVKFQQWAGDPRFPLENVFINLGLNDPYGGNSGTLGNTVLIHQEGDGSPLPTLPYVNAFTHNGRQVIQGERIYRSRRLVQLTTAGTNTDSSSTTFVPVAPLTGPLTNVLAGSRIRISVSLQASKLVGGYGLFILYVNGVAQGATQTGIPFNQFAQNVAISMNTVASSPGDYFVGLYFLSSDGNTVRVTNGVLTIEELA